MVLAITVPTAIAGLVPAITTADVAKTLAAAPLTQPETVRLLPCRRLDHPGHTSPAPAALEAAWAVSCYAYPERGGRVVLKADVPGLVHKSDAGGVQLDLDGEQDVRRAYRSLAATFSGRRARFSFSRWSAAAPNC